MKPLILVTLLVALAPVFATAQSKPAPKKMVAAATRPAVKPSTKSKSAKPSTKAAAGKHATRTGKKRSAKSLNEATNRDELRSLASQLAAGTRAADRALTPAELEVAGLVQTGRLPCELGNVVDLLPDPKSPGHFELGIQKMRYHMTPVETTTGAVRLEDQQAGVVWLQLANKSMLMNQKIGQRLADDCQSPSQLQVAEAMKRAPAARGLLDDAPPDAVATPAASASR